MEEAVAVEKMAVVELKPDVTVMNQPANSYNEEFGRNEQTDSDRKQQIDLEGIGISEIHNLSDTNVARVGESITDVTDKNEFVETREIGPVDKADWIVRRISVILLRLIYLDSILLL